MTCTSALLLLLLLAATHCCASSSLTPDGCGEQGCVYKDNTRQRQYQLPESDICVFRGMPVNCNMFLRLPCIFNNMGPSSWGAPGPQGGRGPRTKRQVSGATAITSTRGFSYPFGLDGGFPFMGGYDPYFNNQYF